MSADTVETRARQVVAALRALGRALAEQRGFNAREPLPVDALEIDVSVPLGRGAAELDAAARALSQRLDAGLAEALRAAGAFEQGRVVCFLCGSSRCEHSSPPEGTSVFAGYAANGRPEWLSFANLCLARGEERVDRLYAEPPEIIGLIQGPSELVSELLPGFGQGERAWRILGQVVVGLVPRDLTARSTRAERVALTLQLVETGARGQHRRLRLNVLGLTPEEIADAAADGEERGPAEALRRTLAETRARVDTLGLRLWRAAKAGEPADEGEPAMALLGQLRGDIERVFRSSRHRTRHAQERHVEGERPTALANEDLAQASDEQCLTDTRRDTIVVLGPQRRVHVFTAGGRHVTSLRLREGELDRKLARGRWQSAPPQTLESLRAERRAR
ncbi:MAG: hypothetical protein H6744_10005 [Deltaproteobacteria bacterium]|nr:hypothetical protein [Deltaproteobacteria bacterium]